MTKIIELFEIYMDGCFYTGFTEQLAENEPLRYEWELNEFKQTC